MKEKIQQIRQQIEEGLASVSLRKSLFELKMKFLGKTGEITALLKGMRDLPPEERPEMGKVINSAREWAEEVFAAREEELKKAEKKLETACSRLSEIRKEYSHQLEEKVIQGLKDLNFLDVQFAITFSRRSSFTENGYDEIQYEISTNPGESLKPLGKIVSHTVIASPTADTETALKMTINK